MPGQQRIPVRKRPRLAFIPGGRCVPAEELGWVLGTDSQLAGYRGLTPRHFHQRLVDEGVEIPEEVVLVVRHVLSEHQPDQLLPRVDDDRGRGKAVPARMTNEPS